MDTWINQKLQPREWYYELQSLVSPTMLLFCLRCISSSCEKSIGSPTDTVSFCNDNKDKLEWLDIVVSYIWIRVHNKLSWALNTSNGTRVCLMDIFNSQYYFCKMWLIKIIHLRSWPYKVIFGDFNLLIIMTIL